jgi:hypothetical protein
MATSTPYTAADVMANEGWALLVKILAPSGGETLDSIAQTLADNVNGSASPTGGAEVWYTFKNPITLCNFTLTNFSIGLEWELGWYLVISGTLLIDTRTALLGTVTVDELQATFSAGGAVISGEIKKTYTLPVLNWSLTNPLLVMSVTSDVAAPGIGGIFNMNGQVQSSFMILILPPNSGGPQKIESIGDLGNIEGINDVFIMSLSPFTVTTILGACGINVPGAIASLLDIVTIEGSGSFRITDPAPPSIANGLDSQDPVKQSAALTALTNTQNGWPQSQNGHGPSLPTDASQVVILTLKDSKGTEAGWSITNLGDQSQYSLAKNADGTIQVTCDAQIYCVQQDSTFAGNTYKAGNSVTGGVAINLPVPGFPTLSGTATVGMYPQTSLDADLDPFDLMSGVFSINSAHLSYAPPTVDPSNPPGLGDPHLDFGADVTLLGLTGDGTLTMSTSDCTCAFSVGTDVLEVSGSVSLLPSPGVSASVTVDAGSVFIPPFGPTVHLGGLSAGIAITASSLTIDNFDFDVLGVSFSIPSNVSINNPAGVAAADLAGLLGHVPDDAVKAVLDAFESFFDPTALAKAAAAYLTNIGYDIEGAAKDVLNALSAAGGDLSNYGQAAADTVADAIKEGWNSPYNPLHWFGLAAAPPALRFAAPLPDLQPVLAAITKFGLAPMYSVQHFAAAGMAPGQLVGPLKQLGYRVGDIGPALMQVYQLSAVNAAPYLTDAGFPASDVAAFIAAYNPFGIITDRLQLAQSLVSGYGVDAAADCFRTYPYTTTLNGAETVSFVLGEAGYEVATQWPDPDTTYYIACAGGLTKPGSALPKTRLLSLLFSVAPFVSGQPVEVTTTLGFVEMDDGSGAQRWQFKKLPDGTYQIYNPSTRATITVPVNIIMETKGFLSCHQPGNDANGKPLTPPVNLTTVDLFSSDDNSGRQQWTLTPTGDGSFNITIEKAHALDYPDYKYLSCPPDGSSVNLWNRDDESGRQQWRLLPSPLAAEPLPYHFLPSWSPDVCPTYVQEAQSLVKAGYAADAVADLFRTYPFNMVLNAAEAASVLGEAGYKVTTQWPEPGQAYFIVPAGGLANPSSRLLNVVDPNNALNFAPKDDGSGRQYWTFTQVVDGVDGVYTISPLTSGWPNGGFLSCDPAQSVPVNVWSPVDSSGRQHWTLTPVGDGSFTITIETKSALDNYAYKYLSCKADGTVVDLWWQDGGGLQEWRLLPWPAADGTAYVIQTDGEDSGTYPGTYLAPSQDQNHVEFSKDPYSWTFQMVTKGVYRIKAAGLQRYLSCHLPASTDPAGTLTTVDLYVGDDDSGRQRWTLTPTGDGSFTMRIETPGALTTPDYNYLSVGSQGTFFDLWNVDDPSGRQRWRVSLAAGS